MKKIGLLGLLFIMFWNTLQAQKSEVFLRNGKTLIFTSEDAELKKEVKEGLVQTFFKVYPIMAHDFNPKVTDTIRVKIDTAYAGVAYAHNGKITISSEWLRKKPNDLDVITHEVMHIVQSYPPNIGPGWLTEGIADYVRFKYGVDNVSAQWALPEYSVGHSYTDSYRITARFLVWITENYNQNIVTLLDKHMRAATYNDNAWKKYTGKSLEGLWEAYQKHPEI